MKYQISIITLIYLIISSVSFGQGISGRRVLETPFKFQMPKDKMDLSVSGEMKQDDWWIVFSDRINNKTATSAGGSDQMKTLKFMDFFYVLDESGEYLHIVKDINLTTTGILNDQSQDFGWISKENLVLWKHCLVTDKGKGEINRKAMVLNTKDAIEKASKGQENQLVSFYKDTTMTVPSKDKSQLFQVYFVFKMTSKAVLLAKSAKIDESNASEMIAGWVRKTQMTLWDHRVALEPNCDDLAGEERKTSKIPAMFFLDENSASAYQNNSGYDKSKVLWNSDPYADRPKGEWRRFPILKDLKNGILRVGVMGEIQSMTDEKMTTLDKAEADKTYNDKREKARNVNIVFVMDGTGSMTEYFATASSAVKGIMDDLKENYPNEYRFGAVVYRDWGTDGSCLIERKQLSSEVKDVAAFLKSIQTKDCGDKDIPEAMFYGIKDALRSLTLPDNETNLLILIGDAGNHKQGDTRANATTRVTQSEINKLIAQKRCHFIAFQTHNADDPSFADFNTQMKDVILQSNKIRYDELKKSKNQLTDKLIQPTLEDKGNNTFGIKDGVLAGVLIQCEKGKDMSTDLLKKEIQGFIVAINQVNEQVLQSTNEVVMEGKSAEDVLKNTTSSNKYVSSYAPAVIEFLATLNISKNKLDFLCQEKYQLYLPAFTSITVKTLNNKVFKNVIFVDRIELSQIVNKFEELINAPEAATERIKMQESWLELLQKYCGYSKDNRAELLALPMQEITKKLFGLPNLDNILSSVRLQDITDESVVSKTEFRKYVEKIKSKQKELQRIFYEENYEYSFRSNDIPYYWIEENLMP